MTLHTQHHKMLISYLQNLHHPQPVSQTLPAVPYLHPHHNTPATQILIQMTAPETSLQYQLQVINNCDHTYQKITMETLLKKLHSHPQIRIFNTISIPLPTDTNTDSEEAQHIQDSPIFFIHLNYVYNNNKNKVLPPYGKFPCHKVA